MTLPDYAIRMLCALACGMIIGLERQFHQKTSGVAGVRTNVMVCVGACMYMAFSRLVASPDETRIAAQIVTGIGFLGAGVIIHHGPKVRGLTTAATIWCAAAIGILHGYGFYLFGFVGTAFVLVTNVALRPLTKRMEKRNGLSLQDTGRLYEVVFTCPAELHEQIKASLISLCDETRMVIASFSSHPLTEGGYKINASLLCGGEDDHNILRVVREIGLGPGVSSMEWRILRDVDPNARSDDY